MSGLKLQAADAEDISVIASVLQDALIPVGDMTFLLEERQFAFVANRFRWEGLNDAENDQVYERVRSGVVIEGVTGIKRRGFDLSDRSRILSLLTISVEDNHVLLVGAGGLEIRLDVEAINIHLTDYGEPWPTQWRPSHVQNTLDTDQ